MTDNEKLAKWQGFAFYDGIPNEYTLPFIDKQVWLMTHTDKPFSWRPAPDYLNDDAAAMSLLDTLVDKGYDPALIHYRGASAWYLQIFDGEVNAMYPQKRTRREAVVAAVLQLIFDNP